MIPRFSNLKDIVEYHAKKSPGKLALAFQEKQYTYVQLCNAIDSLAAMLNSHQYDKGERIGVILPNSDFFIQALFAIFRIGSSAVLLNPVLHPREIMAFAEDSEVSAIFMTSRQYAKLQGFQIEKHISTVRTLFIWDERENKVSFIRFKSSPLMSKDKRSIEDAIIIYTSGTTGASKGVVLTHANLLSNTLTATDLLGIQVQDRTLVAMPLCHSYTLTLQVLTHLICGAYIRILPRPVLPDTLNRTINIDKITTFSGVTYLFSRMLQRGAGNKCPMKSLRMVTSGAVFMPEPIRKQWLKTFPRVDFFATYGLSEASPLVTVLPKELSYDKPISVGRVIPGVKYRAKNIDDQNNCRGELLIQGPNIMRGYYNNPKATSQAIDRERWLHTGDLVDIDNDGDMTIVGRCKEMINRSGENVYPGEVEAVIANLHGVREVAVVGIPDDELGERVLAAVVPENNSISEENVINVCCENLAPFKVPEKVIFLKQFDKTHTGKVRKESIVEKMKQQI